MKGCNLIDYAGPAMLPDGRLGFTRWCPVRAVRDRYLLGAFDLQSEQVDELVPEFVDELVPGTHEDPGNFQSWNPSMTKALFGVNDYTCSGIAWITQDGIELPGIEVVEPSGVSWRVDDYFRVPNRGCGRVGLASWPAWSPNGEQITFFGMPPAPSVPGLERLDLRWNLYAMSADDLVPDRLLQGLGGPHLAAWSPDSRWLSFAGTVDGSRGTWLFDIEREELWRVAPVEGTPAWSPSGTDLALLWDPGLGTPESPHAVELRIYELSEFLGG
jgi:hypothetical protein